MRFEGAGTVVGGGPESRFDGGGGELRFEGVGKVVGGGPEPGSGRGGTVVGGTPDPGVV